MLCTVARASTAGAVANHAEATRTNIVSGDDSLRTEGDDGGGGLVILRAFLRLWPRRRLRSAFYTRTERVSSPSVGRGERTPPAVTLGGRVRRAHVTS